MKSVFGVYPILQSKVSLNAFMFSTFAATLNTCLIYSQMHIFKRHFVVFFSRALACQVHHSPEYGFDSGGVERERRGSHRETEEGGGGDRETSQPIYLTAIYHSEPMCQQLSACFMVDWLPLPSLPLPPCPVQSCTV